MWFAPTLIALSPLKQHLVGWATREFDGNVSVGSASLGWLSPVEVEGLVAEDSSGTRLAEISSLRTEKTLASLLLQRTELGVIYLQRPHIRCELRADGSNVEDALQAWLEAPKTQTATIGVELKIEDGVIEAAETATGRQWTVDDLDLLLTIPSGGAVPATLQLQAQVTEGEGVRATLEVEGQWQPPAGPGDGGLGKGNLSVRTSALPLGLPAAVLKRLVPQLHLTGLLTSDVQLAWQGDDQQVRVAQMDVEELTWTDPTWMGSDRLFIPLLRVTGEATRAGDTWRLRDFAVTSAVARLSASGTGAVPSLAAGDWSRPILRAVSQAQLQADGSVDVAQLAAMMPHTLRIRQGTRISSGEVSLKFSSEPLSDGHRWSGRLLAENLAAVYQDRRIAWKQPIEVRLAARRNQGAITLDQLEWVSSFLSLIAQGSLAEGSLSLEGDLARFRAEASQFIELGDLQLKGKLQAKMDWRGDRQGRVVLDGQGTADDFQLVAKKGRPWREQRLAIRIGGTARTNQDGLFLLDDGNLELKSGMDQLTLDLLEPMTIRSAASWPVRLRVVGDISRWMSRIQAAVPLDGWDLDGALDLEATARVSPKRLALSVTRCSIQDLYGRVAGLDIAEPMMQLEAQGEWDRTGGQFRLQKGTLASTSVAMRVNDVLLAVTGTSIAIHGQSSYRIQLERVGEWFGNTGAGLLRRVSGEATGQVRLSYADHATTMACTAEVKDFTYQFNADSQSGPAAATNRNRTSPTVWHEPKLELTVNGNYNATRDTLQFSTIRVAGQSLDVSAQGQVSELQDRCVVQLDGQIAYDLERMIEQFGRRFAGRVRFVGRDTRPFSLNGPLFAASAKAGPTAGTMRQASTVGRSVAAVPSTWALAGLRGDASVSWQAAAIEGIPVGPGTLDTRLEDGILVASPMDFDVSGGSVSLAPRLLLNQNPMVLTLPSGSVAERVRLSPEMCRGWLKYVAPLVADAASAEGTFSVTLDKTIVPVAQPSNGEIQGTLSVHSARIGPGPLSRELLTIATQIKSIVDGRPLSATGSPSDRWIELPQQNVSFTMVDRQVHHQGLQFVVDDVVIRTRGSVALDQSLNLIAEVPIRDEWVARNRYLASLRGQVLQLPIQGTLKNPRVDGGALARLGQQTLGGAATRMLEQELNRGLQRLLGPRE
ncbi:MAG: hypothetical protein ACC628_12825 [Pirellulaceae bacterium]